MTRIISNGSKWSGESPDKISTLLHRLKTEPLDPTFEKYGNFIYKLNAANCGDLKQDVGKWHIFGNFFAYSHVFDIITDNRILANLLRRAIRANQQTAAYLSAPAR